MYTEIRLLKLINSNPPCKTNYSQLTANIWLLHPPWPSCSLWISALLSMIFTVSPARKRALCGNGQQHYGQHYSLEFVIRIVITACHLLGYMHIPIRQRRTDRDRHYSYMQRLNSALKLRQVSSQSMANRPTYKKIAVNVASFYMLLIILWVELPRS